MTYRSIEDINNEINEVKLLLNPLTDFLIKNPNDLSVKANANSLKDRLHQLNVELALENLNDIISCGDNEELLLDKMKTMGTQPIFKYKNLLKILKNNKLNLDMYKSVAPKGFEPQCLSSEFAKKVYEVIDDSSKEKSDTIDIMGELYIIDTHRNVCSLEISSEEGNELKNIKFSFDKKFKENLKNNIEETIHVILNRIIEYNPIEDNEKITYKLKDML